MCGFDMFLSYGLFQKYKIHVFLLYIKFSFIIIYITCVLVHNQIYLKKLRLLFTFKAYDIQFCIVRMFKS